jgi:hypothetical protein
LVRGLHFYCDVVQRDFFLDLYGAKVGAHLGLYCLTVAVTSRCI